MTDEGIAKLTMFYQPLHTLKMAGNPHITETSIESIATNCPKIKNLNINFCTKINGNKALFFLASHFPPLEKLSMAQCHVTSDSILENFLLACPKINKLNISNCAQITEQAFTKIPEALEIFDVTGCTNIGDETFVYQINKNIKSLSLANTRLTDQGGDNGKRGLKK